MLAKRKGPLAPFPSHLAEYDLKRKGRKGFLNDMMVLGRSNLEILVEAQTKFLHSTIRANYQRCHVERLFNSRDDASKRILLRIRRYISSFGQNFLQLRNKILQGVK